MHHVAQYLEFCPDACKDKRGCWVIEMAPTKLYKLAECYATQRGVDCAIKKAKAAIKANDAECLKVALGWLGEQHMKIDPETSPYDCPMGEDYPWGPQTLSEEVMDLLAAAGNLVPNAEDYYTGQADYFPILE